MKSSKPSLLTLTLIAFVALAAGSGSTIAQPRKSKTVKNKTIAAPRTVKDFFMLLPAKYFPALKGMKNRARLIETEDSKNGYLWFGNNQPFAPDRAEMQIFKRMSGFYLIVVSYNDCDFAGDCADYAHFLEYKNGKFNEVEATPNLPPRMLRDRFEEKTGREAGAKDRIIYELPRTGKTLKIRIGDLFDSTIIYELEWDGNIFDFAAPNE